MTFSRHLGSLAVGIFLALLAALPLAAQSVQRQRLQPRDPTQLYREGRAAHALAYYWLPAARLAPRGILLLLPGMGCAAPAVFRETALGQEASRAGLVTVVPTLNNRLYLDSASTQLLDTVLQQVRRRYPTVGGNLVIGGFSAGGHLALAYAERLVRDTTRLPLRVRAVFGVDPPVDMAVFWQMGRRRIAENCSALLVQEGRVMTGALTQGLGGSPAQVPAAYRRYSAFASSEVAGGNLSLLRATPVRVYCEPDLAFWRWHFCATMQLEDLNANLLKPLVDCLRRQGNNRAQYIETSGKGRRGRKPFPHSWTIVDAAECVGWLQEHLGN